MWKTFKEWLFNRNCHDCGKSFHYKELTLTSNRFIGKTIRVCDKCMGDGKKLW